MFQVNAVSALDERWEERDKELYKIAGRTSDGAGAGGGLREHQWLVKSFREALRLRKNLERVKSVRITIREHTSEV